MRARRSALDEAAAGRAERLAGLRTRLDAFEGEEAVRQAAWEALTTRREAVAIRRDAARHHREEAASALAAVEERSRMLGEASGRGGRGPGRIRRSPRRSPGDRPPHRRRGEGPGSARARRVATSACSGTPADAARGSRSGRVSRARRDLRRAGPPRTDRVRRQGGALGAGHRGGRVAGSSGVRSRGPAARCGRR